jgi:hypothetical protein
MSYLTVVNISLCLFVKHNHMLALGSSHRATTYWNSRRILIFSETFSISNNAAISSASTDDLSTAHSGKIPRSAYEPGDFIQQQRLIWENDPCELPDADSRLTLVELGSNQRWFLNLGAYFTTNNQQQIWTLN